MRLLKPTSQTPRALALQDLGLFRTWRQIRKSHAQIIDSTESWIEYSQEGALDVEDVLALASFRQTLHDLMGRVEETVEFASAADRVAYDGLMARAQAALERLDALPVDETAVCEAVEEMRERTRTVLQPRAPVRRLLTAARETRYIPVMLAALEAAYALDCDELDP